MNGTSAACGLVATPQESKHYFNVSIKEIDNGYLVTISSVLAAPQREYSYATLEDALKDVESKVFACLQEVQEVKKNNRVGTE